MPRHTNLPGRPPTLADILEGARLFKKRLAWEYAQGPAAATLKITTYAPLRPGICHYADAQAAGIGMPEPVWAGP